MFTQLSSPNAGGIAVQNLLSSDFEYVHLFRRHSPPNFKVVRNRAKFCMFVALKIFWGGPFPKFWTGIINFGLVLTIVQNFARRSADASRRSYD